MGRLEGKTRQTEWNFLGGRNGAAQRSILGGGTNGRKGFLDQVTVELRIA